MATKKCDYCGKEIIKPYGEHIYRGDCCVDCRYIKAEENNLKKYGVKVPSQLQEFKDKMKYVFGDLVLLSSLNFICSIFTTAHILAYMFLTFSGIISLYVIVSFTMEILNLYFKNEVINKVISLNKKIGLAIANPIIKSIEKITND